MGRPPAHFWTAVYRCAHLFIIFLFICFIITSVQEVIEANRQRKSKELIRQQDAKDEETMRQRLFEELIRQQKAKDKEIIMLRSKVDELRNRHETE